MILWDSIFRKPHLIVNSSAFVGFGAGLLYDGKTSTQMGMEANGNNEIVFDFQQARTINHIGMAKFELIEDQCTLVLSGSNDNTTYTQFYSIQPTDNKVHMDSFASVSYRYIKIKFTSPLPSSPIPPSGFLGDLFLGTAKELERSQKFGFIKPLFADQDKITANVTRGQNLVGINRERKPKRVKFELFYYSQAWFSDWAEITESMKQAPFYIQWQPGAESFFCWLNGKAPEPRYSQQRNDMYNAVLDVQGILE